QFFFLQAEDGIRAFHVTGVQTCALPILTKEQSIMREQLLERFISYVQIGTQSDPSSESCPSTEGQWVLARQLVEELKELGLSDVTLDDHGYVMATLPANCEQN